jgi:hypothetical protein
MIELFAVIGSKAILFMYAWLLGCMLASTAAGLKGYPERAGLGTGLFLSILGGAIWMFMPWRRDSRWDRAVRPTDLVTVAGGFLLGASAFMRWFEHDDGKKESLLTGQLGIGLIAAAAALLAISHVLLAASEAGPGWILTSGRKVVLAAGAVALVAVLFRVVSPPGDASLAFPAYLGVIGAALIVVGPLLARLAEFPRASQMEHGPLPAGGAAPPA